MTRFLNWLTNIGYAALNRILPFLLILIAGVIVIKIVKTIVKKILAKSKLEKAAHTLIKTAIQVVLYILLGLIVASKLGIDVTGVVALASVLTLAVSLSVQNALTNVIGGFTLLYTKPFHTGDYVEVAGQGGTVKEIGMTYTKLTTPDNKIVSIPNSAVVSAQIVNYSTTGTRRLIINVSASYDSPQEKVYEALLKATEGCKLLEGKEPFVALTGYGDSAIDYTLRVWVKTEDYWDVNFLILSRLKGLFDEHGVEMTYPHLTVHLDK